jgi:phasin
MGEMADKGMAQAKEGYERISAATAEASNALQNAYLSAARGATEYNAKLVEFARVNSNAAFDYVDDLLSVKSPSEFLAVTAEHARKQFQTLSSQAREFTVLSQKVTRQAAEPLGDGAERAFRGPLS